MWKVEILASSNNMFLSLEDMLSKDVVWELCSTTATRTCYVINYLTLQLKLYSRIFKLMPSKLVVGGPALIPNLLTKGRGLTSFEGIEGRTLHTVTDFS
uniref:RibD_C domain-containing protein n=1 Tax=Heterorhabditis bacteriophora TaxID=37862 RepID=A0A1I7WC82_HETBA